MRLFALLFSALLIQACAFTDATLSIAHDENANFTGPIEDLDSITFSNPDISDARTDQLRVGWKKNGYGQNTADILSDRPVTEILSQGLIAGLQQNGIEVGSDGDVEIIGSVDTFWLETDMNFWTIEFTGDVQCTLKFLEPETGNELYSSNYTGSYSVKKGAGSKGTWEEVISKALDNVITNVMYDEDLVEALSN